jgi:hypothetical protein
MCGMRVDVRNGINIYAEHPSNTAALQRTSAAEVWGLTPLGML